MPTLGGCVRRQTRLGLLAAGFAASAAHAQSPIVLPYAGGRSFDVRCDSGATLPIALLDAQIVLTRATERASPSAREFPSRDITALGAALRPHLKVPDPAAMPHVVWRSPRDEDRGRATPLHESGIILDVHRSSSGRLDSVIVREAGTWRGFADSVTAAWQRAVASGQFVDIDPAVAVLQLDLRADVDPPVSAVPLQTVQWPHIMLDRAVRAQVTPQIEYPAQMRQAGVEGRVRLRYIVTADGRAAPETFTDLIPADDAFARPARSAVARTFFRPAIAGRCRVPLAVTQPFVFRIADR